MRFPSPLGGPSFETIGIFMTGHLLTGVSQATSLRYQLKALKRSSGGCPKQSRSSPGLSF